MSVKPSTVERLADDRDLAVHHPRGGDDVGARACLRDGHRGIQLVGGVVVDPAAIVEHAAVAVVGELVEAGVGHHHEVVADRLAHRAQGDVEDAVGVDRAAAGRVLVTLARHAEEHDAAETRVDTAPGDVDDARQRVVLHARHRRDRCRGIDPVGDEDGQHEVARVQPRLGDERAQRRGLPQAAGTLDHRDAAAVSGRVDARPDACRSGAGPAGRPRPQRPRGPRRGRRARRRG